MAESTGRERRLHPRIRILDQGMVVLRPGEVITCRAVDISMGGLSFIYEGWKDFPHRELKLDFIDGPLCLEKVPVQVVSDVMVSRDVFPEAASSGGPAWRRCGVRFLVLTEAQAGQLAAYLASMQPGKG